MRNDCRYNKSESDFPVCEWRNHNARKVTTSTACIGQWFRGNVSLLARAKLPNWNFQSAWYFFSFDCGFLLVVIDSNSEILNHRSLITLTASPYTWHSQVGSTLLSYFRHLSQKRLYFINIYFKTLFVLIKYFAVLLDALCAIPFHLKFSFVSNCRHCVYTSCSRWYVDCFVVLLKFALNCYVLFERN